MAYEYSYFRARGRSLTAIETVDKSKAQYQKLEGEILQRFGAHGMT